MGKSLKIIHHLRKEDEDLDTIKNWQNLEQYKAKKKIFEEIKINLKCKTPGQKVLIKTFKNKEVTFATGQAGTGKTYLACAAALKMLKNESKYEKIIIAKSVTPIPGEELGYLKGTVEEKMDPYMWSFWTNFDKIIGKENVNKLKNQGLIEVWPLAFIRGSNIDNTITIVDEAQNITKNTMKTILTRIGKDSKMLFLGDEDQVDLKRKSDSCLNWYTEKFKDFEPFGIVKLSEKDEVRNPLISQYLKKLKEIEKSEKTS